MATDDSQIRSEMEPTSRPAASVKAGALRKSLHAGGLDDFIAYVRSPWRIIWTNLLAGIFRGLGVAIGATAVLALLIWMLALVREIPLVGQYADQLKNQITEYAEDTRYSDDFQRIENLLQQIEEQMRQQQNSQNPSENNG
ncbi:MAG: hypothetical protein KDJ38_05665 [Gammaproteobacteria bacterium]|nr:hypothetical protein [Gammaproteobacteria bacterium]